MEALTCVCLLTFPLFNIAVAAPDIFGFDGYRLARSPHQTVMLSGFYGGPMFRRSNYGLESTMTAFAARDATASNSYAGKHFGQVDEQSYFLEPPLDDSNTKAIQQPYPSVFKAAEVTESSLEEIGVDKTEQVFTPETNPVLKRKQHKPLADEDEEDDQTLWFFQANSRKQVPSYNAFFPIIFGGNSRGRNKAAESEASYPGGATAIANSFSTGKGGIASSHATAYGDPYLSDLFKKGLIHSRKPSGSRNY